MGKVEVKNLPVGLAWQKTTVAVKVFHADGTVTDYGVVASGYGSFWYRVQDAFARLKSRIKAWVCGCK